MATFSNVKNTFKRNKLIKLLLFVAAATTSPAGFGYLPEAEANNLFAADNSLVQVNAGTKDEKGNVGVRATDAGLAAAKEIQAAQSAAPAEPVKPVAFNIESNIALPAIKRGGQKMNLYPFDKLEVGQSFFVPSTDRRPNPAKALASTVSNANKRYAEKTGEQETVTVKGKVITRDKLKYTRKFTVRAADGGARIWRTA